MRRWILLAVAAGLSGCGYIGEPLPPLLNIPARVGDLAAVQRGSHLIVQCSVPRLSTEGVVLKRPARLELRAGPGPQPFSVGAWAASARPLGEGTPGNGRALYDLPVDAWVGKEVFLGVRAISAGGRDAGWSNFVILQVVAPLKPPLDLQAEAVPEGVRLNWQGRAERYRVWRRAGDETAYASMGDTDRTFFVDTRTEYGKRYAYQVQALVKAGEASAESELGGEAAITPADRFPPAAPAGLNAVASAAGVELTWDPNAEPDLAGYRIYRAAPDGAFEKIGEPRENPSFSDRKTEAGKKYRYAVSAYDQTGNESARSEPVEVTAP